MAGWRQILTWVVEPEGPFKKGDIVELKSPAVDAAYLSIPREWRTNTFEVIRVFPMPQAYFPGEVAIVPMGWGHPSNDVPPVYTIQPEDFDRLQLENPRTSSLRWEVQHDTPKEGDRVRFLRTRRLQDINLSWNAPSVQEVFLVHYVDPDSMDWDDAESGLGKGQILLTGEDEAFYGVPLEHWQDYIKVVG